jgi:oligopeptidase A
MQYADNRELRARMYRAYATRAAEFHDGSSKPEWDNTPLIKRMLELRQEDAQMLGYRNFAEVSLVPKMADTPAQVLAFLRELAAKAKPFAEKDIAELRAFARANSARRLPAVGHAAYVSEKLLQAALRLSPSRR